ncbi:MAG: hypothetical protein PUD59_05845 [bacterium]|nr:hypothetical protein [bacterium]
MDKKIIVDTSSIIGFSLVHFKSISYFELNLIKNEMKKRNDKYVINLDINDIDNSILEWRDFFKINEDNRIELIDKKADKLFYFIFLDLLDDSVKNDLLISTTKVKKYIKR